VESFRSQWSYIVCVCVCVWCVCVCGVCVCMCVVCVCMCVCVCVWCVCVCVVCVCGVLLFEVPVILKQPKYLTYIHSQDFYNLICRNTKKYCLKWYGEFY